MRRQRSKIIFHRAMMCSAAALLLVFQMTAAAICFAEDVTYESVRDGYPDYYYDNESGIGLEQFFSAITVVFLVILILGIIRRGMHVRPRGKPARSVMGSTSSKSIDNGLSEKKQDGRKVRRTIDKWTLKEERKGTCKHEDMHIQTGTKYSGYFESLKTLHGSGLLTTKEMNELLEKHKDDI